MARPDTYPDWREPREGRANPERMTNPFWAHIFAKRMSGYAASKHFGGPRSVAGKPAWSAFRYGQTVTELPDGRTLFVAGEHEDSYDPDFHIYNDVVVRSPEDGAEFYGYPHEVFPPTDFHTATLAGDRLVLIGNLGYPTLRMPGETQVLDLDVHTLAVRPLIASGTPPGWIHKHQARLEDDAIVVSRGLILEEGRRSLVENIDDWRLDLAALRWERLTRRAWPRFEVSRADGERTLLWNVLHVGSMVEMQLSGWQEARDALVAELGGMPDFSVSGVLFAPPVPFTPLPDRDEDEFKTTRIEVDGVVVRYVAKHHDVRVIVEGELAAATTDTIIRDLCEKLAKLVPRPWVTRRR